MRRAAGVDELFGDILRLSNFDGRGPRPVGERHAVGPWGALDMAGNVKEWCANEVGDAGMRYILGGGWHEPAYRFNESDARAPWDREPSFGVRLVRNLGPDVDAARPIAAVDYDPASIVPVPSSQVDLLQRFYEYDKAPPDQTVVLFPSSFSRNVASSQHLDYSSFDYIVRSGRAVLGWLDTYQGLPTPTTVSGSTQVSSR